MTTIAMANGGAEAPAEPEALGPLLKRASKAAKRVLRRIVEPLGLTPVQADALGRVLAQDGLSLNELAERLHVDAPTLSGVVECLVSGGYTERREDSQDRRRLRLFATPKARQIETLLAQAEARREAALSRDLSTAEVEQLKVLLRRVAEAA
jgi:DNA-binding MarR family transcriptional regulator